MIRRPPRATLTYTLFPYTTLFRSRTECLGSVDEVSDAAADTHGAVLFQPKVRPAAKLLVHHRECSLTALEAGFTARPYVGNCPVELLVQLRSEEHTSELQSLMRISYDVFCLKNTNKTENSIQQQK